MESFVFGINAGVNQDVKGLKIGGVFICLHPKQLLDLLYLFEWKIGVAKRAVEGVRQELFHHFFGSIN